MILICLHCEREWDYKGSQEYYATCPNCRWKVSLYQQELLRELKRKEKERGVGDVQDNNIGEEEV